MNNTYSLEALLGFLHHASQRGLMPTATATALTVAARSVLDVLEAKEKNDLRTADLERAIKRFNAKRGNDFNPASLKEYGQRTRRAVEHFLRWQEDPANFSVKTRVTKKQMREQGAEQKASALLDGIQARKREGERTGGYATSVPIRPGIVVELCNIPYDLTNAEAERLAQFVRMLVVEGE
ncbi:MAG: hypothetical protein IPM61_09610 [Chlorobi bacterium]|nr:MAG: hypothetical protein UZ07_CHB004002584 [Chlorobi bacterium OLB7]MBK8911570.1 hypothetical protein [Chlorobiota bacterium]MBX7215734.1 hypothetical protein [Candidatus Kapabacteria bacterium]